MPITQEQYYKQPTETIDQYNQRIAGLRANDTLNSNSLTPQPDLSSQITNPPTPTTPNTTGGQATIDSFNKLIGGTTETTKDTDSLTALMEKYLSGSQAPTSQADLYTQALKDTGYTGLEQNLLTQQGTLKTAQGKLAGINAQLEGLKAEETAIPIRLQEEAQGRGITTGGLAPLQAGELRKVALRAIPLQAQALGAQAEVFAAQGNAELAQNALKIASDKLNTLFTIKSQDEKAKYEYWQDLRNKVFEFASKSEQRKLEEQQRIDDKKFNLYKENLNFAQELSKKAMSFGLSNIAADIATLDPIQSDFKQKLADYQRQIIEPIKPDLLSISEAQTLGVPYGTTREKAIQLGLTPQRQIGLTEQLGGILSPNISAITGKPLTEAERLSQGYATRASEAHSIIDEIGNQFVGVSSYFGEYLPNALKTSDRQRFEQAERNFVNAILRRESGAVISPSEFENARQQYFPQPGDSQPVILQKARNRQTVIHTLQLAGGVNSDPLEIR